MIALFLSSSLFVCWLYRVWLSIVLFIFLEVVVLVRV